MTSLNIVWPAMYVADELLRFWFLVFVTIAVETFTIKVILKYPLIKSIKASVIGNLVSGFIGVFIMMITMLFWHMVSDGFFNHGTFDNINWIATYIIMCVGSIFIEVLTIKIVFKETIKRLLLPLMIGNLLTYAFIAYSMTNDKKALTTKRTDTVFYYPTETHFILCDSSKLYIHKAKTIISYDDNNKILNTNDPFRFFFEKEKPQGVELEFELIKQKSILKSKEKTTLNRSSDTIQIVLKQKNPRHKNFENIFVAMDTIYFVGPDRMDGNKINYPDWQ